MATERMTGVGVRAGRSETKGRTAADPHGPLPLPAGIAARLVVAGLAGIMAQIHLHLWSTGYRQIHIIGPLFLINGIVAIALGLAVLAAPSRFLAPMAAATALFTTGTLVGLILSLNVGLFGWKEFLGAPIVTETLIVEPIGIVCSAAVAVIYAKATLSWWNRRR
jgi:hypothetical protein